MSLSIYVILCSIQSSSVAASPGPDLLGSLVAGWEPGLEPRDLPTRGACEVGGMGAHKNSGGTMWLPGPLGVSSC